MPSLEELQLNKQLYRIASTAPSDITDPNTPLSLIDINGNLSVTSTSETHSESLVSGELMGNLIMVDGFIRSKNFITAVSGWIINADGTVEFGDGKFRGIITATTGSIGGWTISIAAIYKDGATDAVSSGLAPADYPFYAGKKYADRATAPLRATPDGSFFASSVDVAGKIVAGTGSSIASDYLSGIIAQANLNVSNRGWVQTSVFSLNGGTPATQVDWAVGTFTSADGTAYSIGAGNTGVMAAKTYIYLDTAVSATAYQITTTVTTAVGVGKVLVAIAQNGTGEATFQVINGQGGLNIDGSNVVAGSVSATELADLAVSTGKLAANAVTTAKIATDAITAAEIAVGAVGSTEIAAGAVIAGKITAGTIVAADIAAGAITTAKVAALAITTTELAAGAVTAAKITALTITAAEIAANTITAAKIVAGTITTAEIAAATILAGNIVAGTITGNEIAASTITAGKISVANLAAINADLGAITAGTITLPNTGWIKGGQTAYNTGEGFFLGYSTDKYKFSIGKPTGDYLLYNGSTIKFYSNTADGFTLDYGSNILLKEGGNIRFTSVTAPTACTATLVTVAGNVDVGTHTYKVTYVTATGETELGTASNEIIADANNKQVDLSAIPKSTSGGVTSRKIYRTKAGGSNYYLLATIANNTATTYTDNIADANLTGGIADSKQNDTYGKIFNGADTIMKFSGDNVALGISALNNNITGYGNTGAGLSSLFHNTNGDLNTAVGRNSLGGNTTGKNNTIVGALAAFNTETGNYNSIFGSDAGMGVAGNSFSNNCLFGYQAGVTLTTGINNTIIGYQAGNSITTGEENTLIGNNSGIDITTGSRNITIGHDTRYYQTNDSLNIGNLIYGDLTTTTIGEPFILINGLFFPKQAATASAPTYNKGAIYFDTTLNKLRIGGATGWETITSS